MTLQIEVCLDSVASARAAAAGGAQRVELCDNLLEGGTTPSLGMIRAVREAVELGLMVMIRPRGGDFCYSEDEFRAMCLDVEAARQAGANGVVFGILTPEGDVDVTRCRILMEQAGGLPVTFHRAFDMCRDPFAALDDLIELGVSRVLTSGQEASAFEGAPLLQQLLVRAAGRISIMPGGGVERSAPRLLPLLTGYGAGISEIHVAAMGWCDSPMQYRNPRVFMGGSLRPPEYGRPETSAASLLALREALR
ncbi:copper homeostasis protein CutC [Leeia aquatica]|uniref:PF03932 family protein CutC n=1 Tax=Leeia aquatica TaxID=2725557 RepID=A0A847SCC5_9NEIS|nr:copper homeostasis protein CutC [Leeia aquatica]NLR74788.1 copper homeostasis protein CutC [Leeia aquatica]